MEITYVLELLKPTKNKTNIIEKNILEVQKNRTSIAADLKTDNISLSTKHFNELQQFIKYKAGLSGIDVVYISPKYTSQTCSKCGNNLHSDLNAARNICV